MPSLLTDGLNCGSHYTDCKQNSMIRFQIINLSFTGRKWAVFGSKSGPLFLVVNEWLFGGKYGVLWSVKAGMTKSLLFILAPVSTHFCRKMWSLGDGLVIGLLG